MWSVQNIEHEIGLASLSYQRLWGILTMAIAPEFWNLHKKNGIDALHHIFHVFWTGFIHFCGSLSKGHGLSCDDMHHQFGAFIAANEAN